MTNLKYEENLYNWVRINEVIERLKKWREEAINNGKKTIPLDLYAMSVLIRDLEDIKEGM